MSKEIEKMTAIYEKHKNTMYAVALKILKNPQDAEDAVHNTILRNTGNFWSGSKKVHERNF